MSNPSCPACQRIEAWCSKCALAEMRRLRSALRASLWAQSFHDLVVRERDEAWREIWRLRARVRDAEAHARRVCDEFLERAGGEGDR